MATDFFDAIRQGNREQVERLLSLDPGLLRSKEDGLSPIMVAAYHRHPELASYLADKTITLTIFEAAATGKINPSEMKDASITTRSVGSGSVSR